MLHKLMVVFRIPELKNKVYLTLILLAVYRLGYQVPLPMIDQDVIRAQIERLQSDQAGGFGKALQVVELFSGSQIGMYTIFGLGIMPYISASIIFQLLGTMIPSLEALQKEGEAGRKRINDYTRVATVFLCFFQSLFWIRVILAPMDPSPIMDGFNNLGFHLCAAVTMTAGTMFMMWIGEQIDEYGIGNGISLLIMAGILARMPRALQTLLGPAITEGVPLGSDHGIDKLIVLGLLFVTVIAGVVAITQGQRRIPTQSAKHVRGRRVFGGQRSWLPLRVNQSGVMPIIFASSLLMFPMIFFQTLSNFFPSSDILRGLAVAFGQDRGYIYNLSYVGLIYFFCYFWTALIFNPKDMANNLKDHGSFIPGYRPGKATAVYLERVMVRITYVGAAFLALVAVIPTLIASALNIDPLTASFFGGTGLLIVVSVALDLVNKIDSHLVMRNYTGLLDKDAA